MADTDKMTALVELAGAVAHELNNIFTAVTGNLSLLDEDLQGEPSYRINEVIRTAQRGINLSSKLQAFAGRQPLRRAQVNVNRLVGIIARNLSMDLLRGVNLRVLLCNEPCISFVDEDKLGSCCSEILHNAIAAMPKGGQITVETRLIGADKPAMASPVSRPGDYVLIAISDTGKGMSPEVAARAVDPLFTTKEPGINSGWGLSNCAGFIRQSGGYITLASKVGLGTRVEIYLPLQRN